MFSFAMAPMYETRLRFKASLQFSVTAVLFVNSYFIKKFAGSAAENIDLRCGRFPVLHALMRSQDTRPWPHCHAGSTAWILYGSKRAPAELRLKVSRRLPISLSGVDCRLLRYDIHSAKRTVANS
jgi:hypothetical protein